MSSRPGVPSLLRAINDRAAMDLMLTSGPMSRTQIGTATGLSKVTASQLIQRLESAGLVEIVTGIASTGKRGPSAEMYGVVPTIGYAVALHVEPHRVLAGVADISGRELARSEVDPRGSDDPVQVIHTAVTDCLRRARIPRARVASVVIGAPGLVDPRTGDVRYAFDLPSWHDGLRESLKRDLRTEVTIENDVNLAGLAEHASGAAVGVADFALMWIGRGLGLAVFTGGALVRGVSGGAGEIGYLPTPGAPLPKGVAQPRRAGFQALVGAEAVRGLAREHGISSPGASAAVTHSFDSPRGVGFRAELAGRIAIGLAAVSVVLDPEVIILSGDVARAGGADLAERVSAVLHEMSPNDPRVVTGRVEEPVLAGALAQALDLARDVVLP